MARPKTLEGSAQLGVRLPRELIERLDAQLERMRESMPGLVLGRSDAVRVALTRGLEALEADGTRASRKK